MNLVDDTSNSINW